MAPKKPLLAWASYHDDVCSDVQAVGRQDANSACGWSKSSTITSRLAAGMILLLTFALSMTYLGCHSVTNGSRAHIEPNLLRRAAASSTVLDVFQVASPVNIVGDGSCQLTLMEHSFGNSYGSPFVANYQPPSCNFNRVVLNLTVVSAGRQFDRLATLYLNSTEIWRTSTAEPSQRGIIWQYSKDVSELSSVFHQPQTLIFDLAKGNIVDSTYTAAFNTSLTATFFSAPEVFPSANVVIPISANKGAQNQASAFQVPQENATSSLTIPTNAKRAVLTVSACGQIDEEFWYSNVLSSDSQTFGVNNTLLAYSPFREVQVLIDGELAGVAWPFPVIFTGGIVPGFWRPLVGIDAFDLKEDEIDISPWLSVLSDGKPHAYEIRVVGITDDGKGNGALTTVGNYWVVTGKIFLWLDDAANGTSTSGTPLKRVVTPPSIDLSSNIITAPNGTNLTLDYHVAVQRLISFTSELTTSEGTKEVSWSQTLSYTNNGVVDAQGSNETTSQLTSGFESSSFGYTRNFSYPIEIFDAAVILDASTNAFALTGSLNRGKNVQRTGPSVFPLGTEGYTSSSGTSGFQGSNLSTRQNGSALLEQNPAQNISTSQGKTEQSYQLDGLHVLPSTSLFMIIGSEKLYARQVLAENGTVVADSNPQNVRQTFQQQIGGQTIGVDSEVDFASAGSITEYIGRHPIHTA